MVVILLEPHSDDGFLGCSTLLKLGLIDSIITISDSAKIPSGMSVDKDLYKGMRLEEAKVCAERFGCTHLCLDYPDGELENFQPEIMSDLIYSIPRGSKVFVPSYEETHPDHLALANIVGMLSEHKTLDIVWYAVSRKFRSPTISIKVDLKDKLKLFEELYPSQYEALTKSGFIFLPVEQFEVL